MNEVKASVLVHHTQLCKKRYTAKKKTNEIDKKFMDISHRITNEISLINKSKISSTIIRKRSIFGSSPSQLAAAAEFQKKSSIDSPLITIRTLSKPEGPSTGILGDNQDRLTPLMKPRSSGFGFGNEGSLQMNRIIRKDQIVNNPSISKPNLPPKSGFEFRRIPRDTSDSKKEVPPAISLTKEISNKSEKPKIEEPKTISIEETKSKPHKFRKDTLKKINTIGNLNPINVIKSSEIACMTPGMNKRKLTRDSNNFIDSHERTLKPIAFFGTPGETNDNKVTTPSTNDTPNIIPKEDPKDKVQDSLNFLQKFGVGKAKESSDISQNHTPDQRNFKKDLFVIPPFKRKIRDDMDDRASNSPAVNEDKNKLLIPQIPEFSKSKSANKKNKNDEALGVNESPVKDVKVNVVAPPAPVPEPVEHKIIIPNTLTVINVNPIVNKPKDLKRKGKMMTKYKDRGKKVLSTIQEELKEFIPTQIVPTCPYFTNLIFNSDSKVLMFEKHSTQSFIDVKDKKEFVERLLKFNDEMYKHVSSITVQPKAKINWQKLDHNQPFSVIITEGLAGSFTSYLEYCLQSMVNHLSREVISQIVSESSKYFKNELILIKASKQHTQLENIKEVDEYFKSSSKAYSRKGSAHSGYLSESRISNIKDSSSDESSDESNSQESEKALDNCQSKKEINVTEFDNYPPPSPNKSGVKSTFANKNDNIMSSKRVMRIIQRGNSSKLLNINSNGVSTFGFIKGGGTNPLVSEYATLGDRNNNMSEVYERLKFLCTE